MIGSLRGIVTEIHSTWLLLEVEGVGYRLRPSVATLTDVRAGENAFVYIHDHVREDVHDLFAFLSYEELELFEKLLSISGVGPKVAMTLLSIGPVDQVRHAILSGDISRLTSVPGVGSKTAQKIILELKGQLVEEPTESSADREVLEVLLALGYSSSQARQAVRDLDPLIADTSERVREVLKRLSK
jgi:Holliday junction DNA helicase RuvA